MRQVGLVSYEHTGRMTSTLWLRDSVTTLQSMSFTQRAEREEKGLCTETCCCPAMTVSKKGKMNHNPIQHIEPGGDVPKNLDPNQQLAPKDMPRVQHWGRVTWIALMRGA